jgi:hypothetical protein
MILKNLPHPGFFTLFHREGKLFGAKIANYLNLNYIIIIKLDPNPRMDQV